MVNVRGFWVVISFMQRRKRSLGNDTRHPIQDYYRRNYQLTVSITLKADCTKLVMLLNLIAKPLNFRG
jgi:hypothetical protein